MALETVPDTSIHLSLYFARTPSSSPASASFRATAVKVASAFLVDTPPGCVGGEVAGTGPDAEVASLCEVFVQPTRSTTASGNRTKQVQGRMERLLRGGNRSRNHFGDRCRIRISHGNWTLLNI